KPRMLDQLSETRNVLRALLHHLTQWHGRLWMFWNVGMIKILNKTIEYSELPPLGEKTLEDQWKNLVLSARETWQAVVQALIVDAEAHDVDEVHELEFDDEDQVDKLEFNVDEGSDNEGSDIEMEDDDDLD
ncbi:hypothetical protein DFH28DRAFT_892436, partial [Melampsora americana]